MSETAVALPDVLTIKTVEEVKSRFEDVLAQNALSACVIDCAQVARVDALGLQLLLVAHDTLVRGGCHVTLQGGTEPLKTAVRTLGLDMDLNFES